MFRHGYFFCSLLLFALASAWAVADPTPEELEQQRRRFASWRRHPEQLLRLRQDMQAFQSVKPERREQIIKLDQDLHGLDSKEQAKYWDVLDRLADWLERLPEKDRQAVKQAPDAASRLAIIRELRDQEWMASQPKSIRDEWDKLKGHERTKFVKNLRLEEKVRHEQWQLASKFWRELESKQPLPARLADFTEGPRKKDDKTLPSKVQRYVTEYLLPLLSEAEKKELAAAEGRWPDYPQTLVRIAAEHPSALPPKEKPQKLDQLPPIVKAKLTDGKKKFVKGLQGAEGPNFATKAVALATNNGANPFDFEFWASNFKGLLPPMKEFVEKRLIPKLTKLEDQELSKVNGSWPHYPQMIQELSNKYNLQPPWHILPEAEKWKWDLYREPKARTAAVEGFPAVPKINLRDFARFGLDAEERQKLNLSRQDPHSMGRLIEAYYQRNPQELKRLEVVDRKRRGDRMQTIALPTPAPTKQGT